LGVVKVGGGGDAREFVLADLPGLIEGAHEGAGLGHRFLGHVERCGVLIHLVDITHENVAEAYRTIRAELKAYSPLLAAKPEIVVLNKCDALIEPEIKAKARALKKVARVEPRRISGATGTGVKELMREALAAVRAHRAAEAEAPVQPNQPAYARLTPTPVRPRKPKAREAVGSR
ncbi:MAG: GTPase, partial [Dongiaceae bacterium]